MELVYPKSWLFGIGKEWSMQFELYYRRIVDEQKVSQDIPRLQLEPDELGQGLRRPALELLA